MVNPYDAPTSNVKSEEPESQQELASRWSRLGAVLIDGLIGSFIAVPAMFYLGFFNYIRSGHQPPYSFTISMALIGFVGFSLIHGYFLMSNGQTIGKKAVGIRIVDMNNEILPLVSVLGKRYAPVLLAGLIPIVGQMFSIVDILFIFGSNKRCVHDYIAGTKVVKI